VGVGLVGEGEGGLLVSCARATRGLEDPRWTRAVGDQAGHPPVKRRQARLDGVLVAAIIQ
jgi:hypothetical protein